MVRVAGIIAGAITAVALAGAASAQAPQGTLEVREMTSKLVPSPVKYSVLLPPGYDAKKGGYPLVLLLHGGGGDNGFLRQMQPTVEAAWAAGDLPPSVVVTPDAQRSLYMDFKDGSQKWETFIVTEFVPALRKTLAVSPERSQTVVTGISMGGLGSLRLGFDHPEVFGALAALEAGIEPALHFDDVKVRNSFQRGPNFLGAIYGRPVDKAYWQRSNPANMAIANRDRILASGIAIYVEVGDIDMFHLDEGSEFLHRVLWDQGIPHEYRLVRGADHTGSSIPGRLRDGFRFLRDHSLAPKPADNSAAPAMERVNAMKKAAGVRDDEPRPPFLPLKP